LSRVLARCCSRRLRVDNVAWSHHLFRAQGGIQSTIFQYLQVTLNFQKNDLAALLLVIGLNGLLVQMVLLGPLMRLLGERWLIAFGLVVQIVENVAIALAFSKIEVRTPIPTRCKRTQPSPPFIHHPATKSFKHDVLT
jgi:hypothetical protein